MSSSKVFSILGKNLKAHTAADLEPYLSELKAMEDVEEVHFGGNSLGVEACQAIAAVLKEKKTLKVSCRMIQPANSSGRLPLWSSVKVERMRI